MSTENEIPIEAVSTPDPTALPQETTPITCGICEAIIADDDTQITCTHVQCNKRACLSCIKQMIEVMFGQPALNYPFKCGVCSQVLNETVFDQIIIEQGQYEKYVACVLPLYWLNDCLEENEKLVQCPFCPYLEIHTTDACPLRFFKCQHPLCGQKSCLICLHAIDGDESTHQSRCVQLRSYKQLIEKAIESGLQQHCPYCQLTGLKDDGCTHMVCQRCERPWCYLCGMKENECKVDDGIEASLSAHNADWESNEGRCPMSLVSIRELDIRWPENDRDCLEYFHRYRTLCQLYGVLKIIGEEKFDEVNHYFGTIDASGYTIEEIKDYENRILIDYSSKGNS